MYLMCQGFGIGNIRRHDLPERTGYILFKNTEKVSSTERSDTVSATSLSFVKKYASSLWKKKHKLEKITPISNEVAIKTLIENLTALAFPLPSSFATLTL